MAKVVDDPIDQLIMRAGFSEDDRDIGTSGLCAMFALAFYRELRHFDPKLVFVAGLKNDGTPAASTVGGIYWRHAAVRVGDRYYDIEGRQEQEWLLNNYGWGMVYAPKVGLVELPRHDFIAELRGLNSAVDWWNFQRWSQMLSMADRGQSRIAA